jgi:hypothetical protein
VPGRDRWASGVFVGALLVQMLVLYLPRAPSPGGGTRLDLVVHLAVFALVTWAGRRWGLSTVAMVLFGVIQALSSELIQHWLLPDRSGDPLDVLADLCGILVGTLIPLTATAVGRGSPPHAGQPGRDEPTPGRSRGPSHGDSQHGGD